MKILAIETSCDETSSAIVENGRKIFSNIVSSQVDFHKKYGGIVPEIAARKHVEVVNAVIQQAMDEANLTYKQIDAIAVTHGPGLVVALMVGICAAKALAFSLDKPLIAVNHLEGHIYSNFLTPAHSPLLMENGNKGARFPFICLLVSGGHTMIILAKDHGKYEIIGKTRDDAAGEAFDKVARFLNLGYPGGPIIDSIAKQGNPRVIAFPKIMSEKEHAFDFSFSGIKTAVINYCHKQKDPINIPDLTASFQQAVVDVLTEKTIRAANDKKIKTITLAGGVSANSALREAFIQKGKENNLNIILPQIDLCTDNAAMIASAAFFVFKRNSRPSEIKATANLSL